MPLYDFEVKNEKGEVISRVGDLACVERVIDSTGNHTFKIGLNAGVFAFMGSDAFTRGENLIFIKSFDGENLKIYNYVPNKVFIGRF